MTAQTQTRAIKEERQRKRAGVKQIESVHEYFCKLFALHEQKASSVQCRIATDKVTLPDCTHIIEGNYHQLIIYSFKSKLEIIFTEMQKNETFCFRFSLSGCPRRDKMTPESKFFR